MSETQEIGNQTVESPEQDAVTETLYEEFGVPRHERQEVEPEQKEEDVPTTEQPKTIKVKYLGEEKEVPEEEAPTWIQKGMNHDRIQEKLTEQQKALDELAQMQGFKDHADLIANLPKLREQQQQKDQDAYNHLRAQLRQEFEDAGLDPEKAEAYLDNHPIIKQAEAELAKSAEARKQEEQSRLVEERAAKWQALYSKYPDLVETSQAFNEGKTPDWYTPEMQSRIEKGYDPTDAYELAHRDKIQAQTKKATEQKIIKEQQLGTRGHVNESTAMPPDETTLSPAQMALAEEFGVSTKGVQRQANLLNRR